MSWRKGLLWLLLLSLLGVLAACQQATPTPIVKKVVETVEVVKTVVVTVEPKVTPQPTQAQEGEQPLLTKEEFEKAKKIYFDLCSGCHGVMRKGATGPNIEPKVTTKLGTEALVQIITNGLPGGMPDWGKQGVLKPDEIELMAKFLQMEPPQPPEMPMSMMLDSWKVYVKPEDRPTEPQHNRNWQNFFIVTLRNASQVAVVDGDTKEVVNKIKTGFAVHISRLSKSGRYVYVIGRDGVVTLIDLWMDPPQKVAEVRVCYDARSVDTSKYPGYEDKYAIVGCYWPPHIVVLKGDTLEPITVVSTSSYTYDTGEFVREARVASIVASHERPEWVVSVKETGYVWLVDYTDPNNLKIRMLKAERYLHDGGWAMKWNGTELVGPSQYFLVAANMRNKIVVVDTKEGKIAKIVPVGTKPHPGRGANWVHPEYGPVWATGHIGDNRVAVIGVDPEGHPDYAWKVVKMIEMPAKGTLFIKTHPKSKYVWVDFPLSTDEKMQRSVCVFDKETLEVVKCWEVADYGRAVHFAFNKDGTEVWVSVWGKYDDVPERQGEVVVYDAETLEEIARIKGLPTATGKFNVYNTMNDIY